MADDDLTRDLMVLRDDARTFLPPPAAQVRRRGEQLRHRRQGLIAGGAAAAVVAVLAPLAWLHQTGTDQQPPVAPPDSSISPSVPPSPNDPEPSEATGRNGWPAIPDGFPLTDGWVLGQPEGPDDGLTGPARDVAGLADMVLLPCDGAPPSIEPTDRLAATWKNPEDSRLRELLLFASDGAAAAYADGLRQVLEACPEEQLTGNQGRATTVTEVVDGFVAEIVNTVDRQPAIGRAVVRVAQVGNRVLVSTSGGEVSFGPDQVDEQLAPVLELIRADEPPGDRAGAPAALSDFPLDAGLAVDAGSTLEGPSAGAAGVDLAVCGDAVWGDAPERLALRLTLPESGGTQAREVRVWADADGAVAAMSRLRLLVDGCRRQDGPDGSPQTVTRVVADTGWADAATFTIAYADGSIGAAGAYQFTRVGRSVIAVAVLGETTRDGARTMVDGLTTTTRQLTPGLCLFTEAGC